MKNSKDIDGWFNHQAAYDYLLANMPQDGTFLELGAWLGKSSNGSTGNTLEVKM